MRVGILTSPLRPPSLSALRHTSHRGSGLAVLGQHGRLQDEKPLQRGMSTTAASAAGNGAANGVPKGASAAPLSGYHMPPQEIADIVDRSSPPGVSLSPDRKKVLQLYYPPQHPPITELARDELKLAGLRIDPEQANRSRLSYYVRLSLVDMDDQLLLPAPEDRETPIHGYPQGFWLNYVTFSRDSRHVAFAVRSPGGVGDPPRKPLELWVADVASGAAKCLLPSPEWGLNGVFDDYHWLDEDTIATFVLPQGRGDPPPKPPAPIGPVVSSNLEGAVTQARTYQDLLKNAYDEQLFEHYGTSEIAIVQVSTGERKRIGGPRLYCSLSTSPDAQYLLVAWLERPFSYNVPCGRFPKRIQVWDRAGNVVREVAQLPLAEDIPITFNSCRKGPRSIGWRDDKPCQLSWIECQDGGDPAVQVSPRDKLYTLDLEASTSGRDAEVIAETDLRAGGIAWGNDDLALLYQSWWKTRRSQVHWFAPGKLQDGKHLLFDRNYEDAYSDPGQPAVRRTKRGTYVLAMVDGERKLLMQGSGASGEGNTKGWGNRPFLDLLDVESGDKQRLWQSTPPRYEFSGALVVDTNSDAPIRLDGLQVLVTRETVDDPSQYWLQTHHKDGPPTERQLSDFPHPHPQLKGLKKEILRYKRDDGVDLTATLFTPPNYDKERDGRLPCLVWAYPREFKSKDAAGQLRRSPHQFSAIGSSSPMLWLARGYAILDGPVMPIVAEGEEEPNDTYVEQLTASAKAAIDKVVDMGIVDRSRVAVGGHSYGAFMTANLLAHAGDLFACGVARSGAYNRTLTPFGFQAEERTIWQAPDIYSAMSPFMQAHKIKKPLLLIHGADDDNSGTFPLQSERFYAALKGHGAPCKLVILPHESHGYRARESVMHALHEADAWMKQYCEGEQQVQQAQEAAEKAAPDVIPIAAV